MASRWAWIPQVIVLLILVGTAARHFETSSQSTGGSAAVTADRLSFFSLSLSAPVAWAAGASDFYVYVSKPQHSPPCTVHLFGISRRVPITYSSRFR